MSDATAPTSAQEEGTGATATAVTVSAWPCTVHVTGHPPRRQITRAALSHCPASTMWPPSEEKATSSELSHRSP